MMPHTFARKLQGTATVLLNLALGFAALAPNSLAPVFLGLLHATPVSAQAPAAATSPAAAQGLEGTWQGTLHVGQDLRTVLKVTKADGGGYKGDFYSIDQAPQPFPLTKITLDGSTVKYTLTTFDLKFEGKLSADGKTIEGTSTQGANVLPLVFTRATPETEWSIPKPPPPVPPMAADANPSFEVATIKPSKPGAQGKGFGFQAGHFRTINTDLNDLIAFAYGRHPKQIIGAPDWFGTDLFDIEAKPDAEGRPNQKQMAAMAQKLLEDRFALKLHHEKRELPVYVISVASGGPKITKSPSPDGQMAFFFRALGDLTVRNQNMDDFAQWMQNGVMDRPVVNQTGLEGKYDFQLKWTPDDSQFAAFRGVGAVVPPAKDDPAAPPALYTAITEQLGLKMGPGKVPVDVIVIDHAEKPSAN